ncbi:helix-turn-helix domain-containing protein [Cytobacillus gottheilii]|uniref:helix-turn-helix domain-containing protein n=1 Tax=Cytobacillus gottheilii TaxID=859144 RepID=UPI00159393E4|nr:helix-turn-helix domain-containing protein [Cytobacillus gottheilii]
MFGCYKKYVILYCLQRIADERTIYSVFHLLNGKKSSQTIQDAFLFQLTPFFRVYPAMTRQQFDQHLAEMRKEKWILEYEPSQYRLTDQGIDTLKEQLTKQPLPQNLNGWKFHQLSVVFWERLSLLVQVVSNLMSNNLSYLPIQRKKETHVWLKQFLQETKMDRHILAQKVYDELVDCLENSSNIRPQLLISRLTGTDAIGLTKEQAAVRFSMDQDYFDLHFQSILHSMLAVIKEKPVPFPLLNKVIQYTETEFTMTHSAQKTEELLQNGFTLEEIALYRKLKKNTIEDHVVELALSKPQFEIESFVSADIVDDILEAVKKVNTKQLKHIKSIVPHAQYFEIRLVLAVYGDAQ